MNRNVWRIALAEWKSLFYSPVAWIVLLIFTYQADAIFLEGLGYNVVSHELGEPMKKLTVGIFTHPLVFFKQVKDHLYLYIPLLTMGLISRELSSGSIKLLLSSPVKVRQIIFGKFLAMVGYGFVLMMPVMMLALIGDLVVVDLDFMSLWSGMLGLFLLICTYSAVGIFLSSLTSYQVVAAISTLALLACLTYMGDIGQTFAVWRWFTALFSMEDRFTPFIVGLLCSWNIIYFLLIIIFFLGLTILRLNWQIHPLPMVRRCLQLALLTGVVCAIGYWSALPAMKVYKDLTVNEANTIRPEGRRLLTGLQLPLTATYYINLLDDASASGFGIPRFRSYDLQPWEAFLRWKPDIRIRFVYYYDNTDHSFFIRNNPGVSLETLAKRVAKRWDMDMKEVLTPGEIRRQIDLRPFDNNYVIRLDYNNRNAWLRLYNGPHQYDGQALSESEVVAAVKRMVTESPKMAFLSGHFERSIDKAGDAGYRDLAIEQHFRRSLINQGFDVSAISLKDGEIPTDLAGLAIITPQDAYDSMELGKIRRYLDRGGNLLLAAEPGTRDVLEPVVEPLGVSLSAGKVLQPDTSDAPDLIRTVFHGSSFDRSFGLAELSGDSIEVKLHGTLGFSYKKDGPFTIRPLLMAARGIDTSRADVGAGRTGMDTSYTGGAGTRPIPVALQLNRKVGGREQKLILLGNAGLFDNESYVWDDFFIDRNGSIDLGLSVFGWFANNEFPINKELVPTKDSDTRIGVRAFKRLQFVLLIVLPALVLLSGAIILINRMRQ